MEKERFGRGGYGWPSIASAVRPLPNPVIMIGPPIPNSAGRSTTPEVGPSVGPQIPTGYSVKPVEEEEEEDDYVPELPPDLAAQRTAQKARVLGPSLPSAARDSYDDSDDDDVGPMPLPAHLSSQQEEKSAVEEFLEREKRRQKALEVRGIDSHSIYPADSLSGRSKTKGPQTRRVDVGASFEVGLTWMYVKVLSPSPV